ncbi:acidic mammalian chitinase [Diachasma alloeum]|uniref:acidic mammalian chitinase n=1 Tax=Diachasma alloeum TaxID=454923 RepID=UPI00073847C0|nr:acidic mammalian chitinase [Diachasma alloeum]
MVNQIPIPQAKYELLNTVIPKHSRCSRIVCLTLPLLIIGFLFIIAGVWIDVQGVLGRGEQGEIRERLRIENAETFAWPRRARMYAESAKENQNVDRNSTLDSVPPSPHSPSDPLVVCYYTLPRFLNTSGDLGPSDLDPRICTHIIVGFASVVNSKLFPGPFPSIYTDVSALKKKFPKLKTMISAGGINEIDSGFPEMVKTHASRKVFINSVLNITKMFNLDGLDVDWEFPAWLGGKERERIYFVQLLQEMRRAFDRSGRQLILSAAVGAPSAIIDESYNVPQIAEHVDFVNLMSYDYHYYVWYLPVTGLNAPLYSNPLDGGYSATLNVNYSAFYWVSKGMPREKIVVGIPTYGHSFLLDNENNHGIMAPAKGFGHLGELGFVRYWEVCEFIRKGGSKVFDEDSRTPYVYGGQEWVSFDDQVSVMEKVEWIKSNGFRGAMILSLNTDDWNGTCYENETFPLTRVVANNLMSSRGL